MRSVTKLLLVCLFAFAILFQGCSVTPKSAESGNVLSAQVNEAIADMKAKDPGIQNFFDTSYGYAVMPRIFKGAWVVGGAHGNGEVYEQGTMVGYCAMSQASLGFSFGGQYFSEIVFFKDKSDLDKFKMGQYTLAAQAKAVALTAGAAAKTDFNQGIAVFITAQSGLMVDVSVAGQKFQYRSMGM